MKKIILKYWYILPLMLAILMLTLLWLFTKAPTFFEDIVGVLLVLTIVFIVISWVVLIVNKQWWKFIISTIVSILIVIILGFALTFAAMFSPDGFGSKHSIPEGLNYHLPHEEDDQNVVEIDSLNTESFLQVWNSFQGGIYKYDFYYYALPAGEIFLRCYEVSNNIPLSEDRLKDRSTKIIDSTYSFSKLVDKKEFTIYEGDWEDYYAARIEVWHYDKATGKEKKLVEKIYRVEGWMR